MDMINQIRSTSMHKKLFFIIFIFTVFTAFGCQQNAKEEPAAGTTSDNSINGMDGDKAPNFTLKNTEGKDVSLADYKGKVVLDRFLGYMVSSMP
jgi:cytochrome oxidase Cu insertion factor (SCO1/SenC/PrrC family)